MQPICVCVAYTFILVIFCLSLCFLLYITILLVLVTNLFSEINIATCDFWLAHFIEEKGLFLVQSMWVSQLTYSIQAILTS